MWPFGKNTKVQIIFSVVTMMIGMALVLLTASFIVKVGDLMFYSTILGVILIITGVIYSLEAQL